VFTPREWPSVLRRYLATGTSTLSTASTKVTLRGLSTIARSRFNESFAAILTPYRSRNAPAFFFGDDDDSDDADDAAPGNKRGTKCDKEN